MESRLEHDFGQVRVHTDSRAVESARAINAIAYTVGRDVVFGGAGRLAQATTAGRRLLAHELMHVVQQRGIADLTPNVLEIADVETPFEHEADSAAEAAVGGALRPRARMNLGATPKRVQRACPPTPTGIGATAASEPCTRPTPAPVSGAIVYFCLDSTELASVDDQKNLRHVAREAKNASSLAIHGNASIEGPHGDYNFNLACKRAVKARDLLLAEGVTAPMTLLTHGPTTVYGEAKLNRNVVIAVTKPAPPPPPTTKQPAPPCADDKPKILDVHPDRVIIKNVLGGREEVPMNDFSSEHWRRGNPGNPNMAAANECYEKRRLQILAAAGWRPLLQFEKTCTDNEKFMIQNAVKVAIVGAAGAIEKLNFAKKGGGSALAQVKQHFRTENQQDIGRLISNYEKIHKLISDVTEVGCGGELCEKKKKETHPWLAWAQAFKARITFCDNNLFFGLDLRQRAEKVLHEASHVVLDTEDHAYWEKLFKLDRDSAMDNAETYGNFAVQIYSP